MWYDGTVARCLADDATPSSYTYDIMFDDGDFKSEVSGLSH